MADDDSGLISKLFAFGSDNGSITLPLLLVFLPYCAWRLWTFTLRPSLNPDEPPPLPYWIPFLGHMISLFKDYGGLIEYGHKHFGQRPFYITVVGKRIYIQTTTSDINATYKNDTEVSFYDAVREVLVVWGISPDGCDKIWREGYEGPLPNPHGRHFIELSHDIRRMQLEASERLNVLTDTFLRLLPPLLQPGAIPKGCITGGGENGQIEVALMKLCQQTLIPAGTEALFGKSLRAQRDDIDEKFLDFDTDSWMLLMQLPPSMAKRCFEGRAAVLDAFSKYVELPNSQKEDACWMMKTLEGEMQALEMPVMDQAIMLFLQYWLFHVNCFKLSFWVMAYVVANPVLHAAVLTELKESGSEEACPPVSWLLERSPILNAVFDETQRITVNIVSTRNIVADVKLNGWRYRKDSVLLVPYRRLHFQPAVFGADVLGFDHTRFLDNKGLNKNPNFKPFGGGSTLCTGRLLGRREVLIFVSTLLTNWDISRKGETFPQMETRKLATSVMEPLEDQDMIIRMRPKTRT